MTSIRLKIPKIKDYPPYTSFRRCFPAEFEGHTWDWDFVYVNLPLPKAKIWFEAYFNMNPDMWDPHFGDLFIKGTGDTLEEVANYHRPGVEGPAQRMAYEDFFLLPNVLYVEITEVNNG